jgi:hypothetical protein
MVIQFELVEQPMVIGNYTIGFKRVETAEDWQGRRIIGDGHYVITIKGVSASPLKYWFSHFSGGEREARYFYSIAVEILGMQTPMGYLKYVFLREAYDSRAYQSSPEEFSRYIKSR